MLQKGVKKSGIFLILFSMNNAHAISEKFMIINTV